MTYFIRALLLCFCAFVVPRLSAEPDDLTFDELDDEPVVQKPAANLRPKLIAKPAPPPATPVASSVDQTPSQKRWYVIIPAFVAHGIDPSGGANRYMPRRVTGDGRFVATPGVGLEFQGHRGLEMAFAFVKDCYDNPAGALQFGQHWRLGTGWDLGYSAGLYIRTTPIACMTSTVTTTITGRRGQPSKVNRLSTTQCAFQDNLPLRYTTRVGGGYVDVIPTPFLHASARVYHGAFDLYLKMISNFYLNEFGITIPF